MNNLKTFMLLAGLTALLVFVGGLLGGRAGLMIALIFAAIMNISAYWYSDKLVLSIYKARQITAADGLAIYNIVQNLARKANTPMPKVYIIDSETPNAFATGRNPENASIAATTGLLMIMSKEELTGVLAHELGHVLHRDTLISAVTATVAGAISGIANMFMWFSLLGGSDENGPHPVVGLVLMILAPIAASFIQMAISRSREFEADAEGARLSGNPLWLASALEKLEQASHRSVFRQAETHPATAHLFIVNPLSGKRLAQLFSTHPLTEERIRRLREMV